MTSEDEKKNHEAVERYQARIMDYKRLFSGEIGKRVLDDMKKSVRYGETVFTAGQPDVSAFAAGRQDFINVLVKLLNTEIK